jgi:hypothetical protein
MRKPDSFAPVQSDKFNFSKRKHRLHITSSSTKAPFSQSRISSTWRCLDLRMRKQEAMKLNLEDPNLLLGCLIGISQKECSLYNRTNIGRSIKPCKQICFSPSLERRTCLILVDEEVQNGGDKNNEMIDSYCRQLMFVWCYRIIDRLGFERDTVAVAASYVDRFLSIHQCDRATYKLTCMTALYIACKIHGTCKEVASLPTCFAILSEGEFTAEHIYEMETFLLNAFHWQFLHPPTACAIVRMISLLLLPSPPDFVRKNILDMSIFLTEISVFDRYHSTCNPSSVALASLLLAIDGYPQKGLPLSEGLQLKFAVTRLFHTSGLAVANIQEVQKRLLFLYRHSKEFRDTL